VEGAEQVEAASAPPSAAPSPPARTPDLEQTLRPGAAASSLQLPIMSREQLSSAFRQGAEATVEADRVLQQLGGIHEPHEAEVPPTSPRTLERFKEALPQIKEALLSTYNFAKQKLLPSIETTKEVMSPIVTRVADLPVEISAEAREFLIHNPQILTGLFYSMMFYNSNPDLQLLVGSEMARDPRLNRCI
jgi:hypothetical protein